MVAQKTSQTWQVRLVVRELRFFRSLKAERSNSRRQAFGNNALFGERLCVLHCTDTQDSRRPCSTAAACPAMSAPYCGATLGSERGQSCTMYPSLLLDSAASRNTQPSNPSTLRASCTTTAFPPGRASSDKVSLWASRTLLLFLLSLSLCVIAAVLIFQIAHCFRTHWPGILLYSGRDSTYTRRASLDQVAVVSYFLISYATARSLTSRFPSKSARAMAMDR